MRVTEPKVEQPRRPIGPSLYALPADLLLFVHLVDRRSRDQWKRLPLEALPPSTGPRLVFDLFDAPVTWLDDWNGRTLHSSIELDELIADRLQYVRTGDIEKRAKLAKRIRRRWVGLVDHAIGYGVPGSIDVMEFA